MQECKVHIIGCDEPITLYGPDMPDEPEIRYLGDLQRLEIKPGDKFILTVPGSISYEQATRIREAWQKFAGGDKDDLLILEGEMKLGVIGPV